jgi:hypothetical protein
VQFWLGARFYRAGLRSGGVRIGQHACRIAGSGQRGAQGRQIHRGQGPHRGLLAGQVDRCVQHTWHAAQHLLDAAHARRTAHALDLQAVFGHGHAVAGLAHGIGQGLHIGAGWHRRLLARQVHVRLRHARHGAQGLFDAAHTGRAAHALDLQPQRRRGGGGRCHDGMLRLATMGRSSAIHADAISS